MELNSVFARQVAGLMSLRLVGLQRRSLQHVIYGAAIPWLFMTIIATVTPAADSLRLIVGAGVMSCCFVQLRAPAAAFASERLSGVQRLLTTVGTVETSAYFGAYVLGCIALLTIPIGLLVGMAAVRDAGMPSSAAWIIPTFLLSATLHGLGLGIARRNMGLATVMLVVDLTVTMIVVICPVFYEMEAVPAFLQSVVQYAPPTLAEDAVMQLWRGSSSGWWPTILLAPWAIGCLTIGYRRVRIG